MWWDLLEIAMQLASDAQRDPGSLYPRCWVRTALPVSPDEYYWTHARVVWPDGHVE